jgi:tRNA threonylcarbamoyladenosine biosynthesis protein TsaE
MQAYEPLSTITYLNNLEEAAKQLLSYAGTCKTWLFTGELGSGKTTLIKAICKQLGVSEYVASPTFSLVNTYHLASGNLIHHIDAYRLIDMEEAIEMDFPFYFETGYCFIEWPSKIPQGIIPVPHINVNLTYHNTNYDMRNLCIKWIKSID